MTDRLLRVDAPPNGRHRGFVAGVTVSEKGIIVETAPILRYSLGWTGRRLRAYAAHKGWSAEYVA